MKLEIKIHSVKGMDFLLPLEKPDRRFGDILKSG